MHCCQSVLVYNGNRHQVIARVLQQEQVLLLQRVLQIQIAWQAMMVVDTIPMMVGELVKEMSAVPYPTHWKCATSQLLRTEGQVLLLLPIICRVCAVANVAAVK